MIRSFLLTEIAAETGGQLHGKDVAFSQVVIDSRKVEAGDLYIAIAGARFDGHDFAAAAVEKGAVAVIAERPLDLQVPVLVVDDTRIALGRVGALNRRQYTGPLTAITGSCGKTTTKEMLAAVLSRQGETLFTAGNLNNDIGAPLTLLRLSTSTRYAVIELGASAVGEIAWTSELAAPDIAMITNASAAHLEGFGSLERIVIAKGEIIDGVSATGTIILNHDDAAFPQWRKRAGQRRVISVSAQGKAEADYRAEAIEATDQGVNFIVSKESGGQIPVSLPLAGRHNVANALLVIATAETLGIPTVEWQAALTGLVPAPGRLQAIAVNSEVTILDDSYNANPASMSAALEALAMRPGRKIAVLGDMAELGDTAEAAHRTAGAQARALGVDHLLVKGQFAGEYNKGSQGLAQIATTHEELVDGLMPLLEGPVTVLVKGSRSAGMDQVVALLKRRIKS